MTKNRLSAGVLAISLGLALALPVQAKEKGAEEDDVSSPLLGPSVHLAVGIRSKKAPDLDTYYSTVGGVKLSLFGLQAGNALYFSFLGLGLQYAGYGVFAPSLTPVFINHNFGLGIAFDLYPVRKDRNGGPLGLSLNLDVVRIASMIANLAK